MLWRKVNGSVLTPQDVCFSTSSSHIFAQRRGLSSFDVKPLIKDKEEEKESGLLYSYYPRIRKKKKNTTNKTKNLG